MMPFKDHNADLSAPKPVGLVNVSSESGLMDEGFIYRRKERENSAC
jgi:hypothetical protein